MFAFCESQNFLMSESLHKQVWCHICQENATAILSNVTHEYECSSCQSSFVEDLNQGLEEFMSSNVSAVPSEVINEDRRNSTVSDDNMIFHHIVDRLLGINSESNFGVGSTNNAGNIFSLVRDGGSNNYGSTSYFVSTIGSGDISNDFFSLSGDGATRPVRAVAAQDTRGIFQLLSSLTGGRDGGIRFGGEGDEIGGGSQLEDLLHHILMNETSHSGAPPLSQQQIDSLTRIKITAEIDASIYGECCITQENFKVDDVVVPLPCGHNYQQESIVHWLGMHNTCPVCRVAVVQ